MHSVLYLEKMLKYSSSEKWANLDYMYFFSKRYKLRWKLMGFGHKFNGVSANIAQRSRKKYVLKCVKQTARISVSSCLINKNKHRILCNDCYLQNQCSPFFRFHHLRLFYVKPKLTGKCYDWVIPRKTKDLQPRYKKHVQWFFFVLLQEPLDIIERQE